MNAIERVQQLIQERRERVDRTVRSAVIGFLAGGDVRPFEKIASLAFDLAEAVEAERDKRRGK